MVLNVPLIGRCFVSHIPGRKMANRWGLAGTLSRPWIGALRNIWRCLRDGVPRGHVVVDIRELTAIDTVGAQLLADMQKVGIDVAATGLEEKKASPSRTENRQKP